MLSEIFMLRLEATLRTSNTATLGISDTRFVPIKAPPASPTEDSRSSYRSSIIRSDREGDISG
jgi:hypothetical protein